MREGTAEVPHQSATAYLLEAAAVFDAATALDTTLDLVAPQRTLVARLVRHVLVPRALLPQIAINSSDRRAAPKGARVRPSPRLKGGDPLLHGGDLRDVALLDGLHTLRGMAF